VTLTVAGYVVAGLVFVVGVARAMRLRGVRRAAALAAVLAVAVVIGWFSWLAGTVV